MNTCDHIESIIKYNCLLRIDIYSGFCGSLCQFIFLKGSKDGLTSKCKRFIECHLVYLGSKNKYFFSPPIVIVLQEILNYVWSKVIDIRHRSQRQAFVSRCDYKRILADCHIIWAWHIIVMSSIVVMKRENCEWLKTWKKTVTVISWVHVQLVLQK